MKKLILVFGLCLMSFSTTHAQYQDLIDQKITQIVGLQKQLTVSELPAAQKDQASDVLAVNLALLTAHRNEVDLVKLQALETTINQIHAQLAARVIDVKKARIQAKLSELAQIIVTRRAAGKDTAAFEALWEQMNTALQNL